MLEKESIVTFAFILMYLLLAKRRLNGTEALRNIVRYLPALAAMVIPSLFVHTMMHVCFWPYQTFFDYHITRMSKEISGERAGICLSPSR